MRTLLLAFWMQASFATAWAAEPGLYLPPEARPPASPPAAGPTFPVPSDASLIEIRLDAPDIGGPRSAFVHLPSGPGPFPVVLAFHGGKNRDGLDMSPRLEPAFDEPAILVFPNGKDADGSGVGWIGPGHDGLANPSRDVNFARALIEDLDRRYDIDRSRLYAAGFSNGGYMTHLLACEASDLFAAFMVVSRGMPAVMSTRCEPAPRPFLLMIGTADDGLENEHSLTLEQTLAHLKERNGCDPTSRSVATLPDRGDTLTVTVSKWGRCEDDATFEYFEIQGGGHHWPGHGKAKSDKTRDVDATRELIRFFGL